MKKKRPGPAPDLKLRKLIYDLREKRQNDGKKTPWRQVGELVNRDHKTVITLYNRYVGQLSTERRG